MKEMFRIALMILLAGFFTQAQAHNALVASFPQKDTTLATAEELRLSFNGDVRLVRLVLARADDTQLDLGFTPDATARKEFAVAVPALEAGVYTVNWAVLGADGHTVGDKYSFTIDPAASNPGTTTGHEGHGAHQGAHAAGHPADHAAHGANHQNHHGQQRAADAAEEHQH